jgi:hypothetical protein
MCVFLRASQSTPNPFPHFSTTFKLRLNRFLPPSIAHKQTNAGLMTIAVNPFKKIESLYSEEQIINYAKSVDILSRPHVYAVAQTAYRRMKATQVDQTILVSGLSGSGKTETVKFTIHYLSTIAGGGHGTLEQQINVAGLLLESFGNATTVLNPNSSRFGKYTRIYFDKKGQMSGAEIKTCASTVTFARPEIDVSNHYYHIQIFWRNPASPTPQRARKTFTFSIIYLTE